MTPGSDRFGPRVKDHIMRDLSAKVADDLAANIRGPATLLTHPTDMMMLAISAAGTALGWASGFCSAIHPDLTPEQQVSLMIDLMRPIALKALGGDADEFERLLSYCRPGDGT